MNSKMQFIHNLYLQLSDAKILFHKLRKKIRNMNFLNEAKKKASKELIRHCRKAVVTIVSTSKIQISDIISQTQYITPFLSLLRRKSKICGTQKYRKAHKAQSNITLGD